MANQCSSLAELLGLLGSFVEDVLSPKHVVLPYCFSPEHILMEFFLLCMSVMHDALQVLPSLLRRRLHKVACGIFLHSAFPSSEIFRAFPKREELLRSLLNADVIGFHTFDYARHFISCCSRMLGLDHHTKRGSILMTYYGRDVHLKILPTCAHPKTNLLAAVCVFRCLRVCCVRNGIVDCHMIGPLSLHPCVLIDCNVHKKNIYIKIKTVNDLANPEGNGPIHMH